MEINKLKIKLTIFSYIFYKLHENDKGTLDEGGNIIIKNDIGLSINHLAMRQLYVICSLDKSLFCYFDNFKNKLLDDNYESNIVELDILRYIESNNIFGIRVKNGILYSYNEKLIKESLNQLPEKLKPILSQLDKYLEILNTINPTGIIKFEENLKNQEKVWTNFKNKDGNEQISGYYINNSSKITTYWNLKSNNANRNTYPTKELAEAGLALTQLLQWRDAVNKDWNPNWTDNSSKYCIAFINNQLTTTTSSNLHRILAFESEIIRDQFIKDHKTLIKIAKPLL